MTNRWVHAAGFAGVVAALCWIAGDILIVGNVADRAAFPTLFQIYADRIDADMAERVVGVSSSRLAAGALFGVFSVWLYLVGTWHLWCGVRSCRRMWSIPAVVLVFVGYALSPLPHAAFYYMGAAYQSIAASDAAAHPALLALADEFHRVLLITWFPAVLCQMFGMLWLSFAIASGRSAWPRWLALTTNPFVLALPIVLVPHWWPTPTLRALGAASFNIMWLCVYAQTLAARRKVV